MTIRKILLTILCVATFFANAAAQDTIPQKPNETDTNDSLASDVTDSISIEIPDSLPWPQSLQARLDTIIKKAEILKTSQMGLMVYDLTADSTLYAYDAIQTMRPASTMKLITAITALDKLGADYEYRTTIGYRGKILEIQDTVGIDSINAQNTRPKIYRLLRGDLYLVGGMDPMIGKDDLRFFARKVRELGIDTIRGNLYADRSFKDDDLYGEGWCWDDDNAMLSALVYKRKDNMMEAFLDALKRDSIVFIGDMHDGKAPSTRGRDSEKFHYIADITRPLTTVLKPMMKHSNNLYAESMFYQIGAMHGMPSTAHKARAVEEALLNKIYKDPQLSVQNPQLIHRFADGSGLSLYNYVSADIEVAFLRYAYNNETTYNILYDSLPIAGIDGTISDRMKGTCAKGNVHAKTGTLSGISSLAGYCTAKNGHHLAFAIINQNVMRGVFAKRLQDKICIAITK